MKYLIVPITAQKRKRVDSYENGCELETVEERLCLPLPGYDMVEVMSRLVGDKLTRQDVYTFDPNIYCDTKSPPGYRVVENNELAGIYRVEHDRLEDANGGDVTPKSACWPDFVAGKITLFSVVYELRFRISVVGCGEVELAELLNVTNH